MPTLTEKLEAVLASGQDTAVLRFSLGNAYLATDSAQAARHFMRATELNPQYSAAWKMLGKALTEAARASEAIVVFTQGITVATAQGDVQAAKEMTVFLKRLRR